MRLYFNPGGFQRGRDEAPPGGPSTEGGMLGKKFPTSENPPGIIW